jgi:membrane associated rhomboid family serine protease
VLIDQALERLQDAKPAEIGPTATEVIARVEAEPVPVVAERLRPRGPIATRILLLSIIASSAATAFVLDGSTDVGTLMRSGALVRSLVDDGEWWRIVTFSFVHVGGVHLIVNVIGLWLLGRLAEDLFGPWRTAAIFALTGIAGAVASYLAVPAGISAGASGAIFGLLGAVFIELSLHRKRHRTAWSRGLWGSLAVVAVAQVGQGFFYAGIDQWAHGGGLIVGTIAGILLSPHARWARVSLHVARVITLAFVGLVIVAAIFTVRTSIADSLAAAPRATRNLGTVRVTVPASWTPSTDMLFDPDLFAVIAARRVPATASLEAQLDAHLKAEPEQAKKLSFDQVETATDQLIPLPPGWQGSELVVSIADSLGGRQRYRVVVAGRTDPSGHVLASLYAPETVARAAPAFFTELLGSVQ